MLKFYVAGICVVAAAFVSLIGGVMHDSRLVIILYRMMITGACFGVLGFVLTILCERILIPYLARKNGINIEDVQKVESKDDVNDQDDREAMQEDELESESKPKESADFAPFTTDNFKRVSPPED